MKFCLRHRGSISIFLSIILIPTLIFTGLMVDYANLNLSKGVVEAAGDLATNAALANYDTVLNEVYGLFAMSQAAEDPEKALQQNLEHYFTSTLYSAGLIESDYDLKSESLKAIRDLFVNRNYQESFLGTNPVEGSFKAKYADDSSLANPEILKKQIVEFMKYRGPAEVGLSILDSLGAVKKVNSQSAVSDKKVKVDEAIADLSKLNAEFYAAIRKYDELVAKYQVQEDIFRNNQSKIQQDIYRIGEVAMMYELHPVDTTGLSYADSGGGGVSGGSVSGGDIDSLAGEKDRVFGKLSGEKETAVKNALKTLGDDIKGNTIKRIEDAIKAYREYLPAIADLCAFKKAVDAVEIKYPEEPSKPTSPGAKATPAQLAAYQSALTAYQSAKSAYDEALKEAQRKDSVKKDLLNQINPKLSGIADSICTPMKNHISGYDTARAAARTEAQAKAESVYKQLFTYYDSAAMMADTKHLTWGVFNFLDQSVLEYAIRKGEAVKSEILKVQQKTNELQGAVNNYTTQEEKDGFHTQMQNQTDKYKAQFQAGDVDEIIEQLKAAQYYLLNEGDPLGVIPYLKKLTFYKPVIITDQVDSLKKATDGMKAGIGAQVEADIASGAGITKEYAKEKRDESWDMKANSVIGKRTEQYYVKRIGEAGFKITDKVYRDIPMYYVYLNNACGMEPREEDKGIKHGNLKKEVKQQNKDAQDTAKETKADAGAQELSYSSDIFAGTPSENTDDPPPEFNDLPDGDNSDKGTTQQFSSMQGYFANSVKGLENILMDEIDNLLISEYVFQNFSFATGSITAANEQAEKKGRGYTTLTNVPITKENNAIYGCEVEYILYGHKEAKWLWFTTAGPECNISNAKRDIFALRFMCNSVFALTDAGIDKMTMPPALAIQAASSGVVPYQLVQVTFKLALALAESTYDLDRLMDGEKVALLKSKETFTFSPSGIRSETKKFLTNKIDEGTEAVAEVTLGAIQTAVDQAGEYVDGELEKLRTQINEQAAQASSGALEDIVSTIVNTVTDTVEAEFMKLYSEGKEYTLAALEEAVNAKLDNLQLSTSPEVNGFIAQVRSGITAAILKPVDAELTAAYQELVAISEHKTSVTVSAERFRDLQEKMMKLAKDYQIQFTLQINQLSGKIAAEIAVEANKHLQKAGEIVSAKAGSIINEQGELLSKKTTELMDQYFPAETTKVKGMKNADRTVVAERSFECSYEDYLRIFLFLRIQTGQNQILKRIADLIQINVGTGMKAYGKVNLDRGGSAAHKKAGSFRMEKAYTYVEVEANMKVDPLLISFELFTPKGEKPLRYWYYPYRTMAGY